MTSHDVPKKTRRHPMVSLRKTARRLELRSFNLIPEHFNHIEGYRTAVAVVVPLVLAILSGYYGFTWAVFGAFWTCLCDVPSTDRLRRRHLALFAAFGTVIVLIGSWAASYATYAGIIVGPLLVLISVLACSRIAYGSTVGTLLGVVAVVAVGFPNTLDHAVFQAAAFLLGAAWAYILINHLWHFDPNIPVYRATNAVILRLLDMIDDLVDLGDGAHRDAYWHSEHGEHRRAVRLSIERLRTLLKRFSFDANLPDNFTHNLEAADTIFGAAIALDQAFIEKIGSVNERLAVARVYRRALMIWYVTYQTNNPDLHKLQQAASRIRRLQTRLKEDVFIGCAIALITALDKLSTASSSTVSPSNSTKPKIDSGATVHQAIRQSVGLLAAYFMTYLLDMEYTYWAAMAVVVVLQGGARITWARCLERILGSILGGFLALALLHASSALPLLSIVVVILAAAAISLKSVNYTIFVIFLTALFVLVTEMLQPGNGITDARMMDNIIGSVSALFAVVLIWPDFGLSNKKQLKNAVDANRLYFEAVSSTKSPNEVEDIRRAAGLASIQAESALHDFGGIMNYIRPSSPPVLQEIRTIAGRSAIIWHRRLATEFNHANPTDNTDTPKV